MAEWWHCRRPALLWWLLAVGLAATLKWSFSVAAASELAWMLWPVSRLLRLVAGWHFEQSADDEWYSLDAGIVLVKACAGINFMIMSFLGWCWMFRPMGRSKNPRFTVIEWPLLLGSVLVFAWATALVVNTLRILAIVRWQPVLEEWLPGDEAHRLLGLLVYVAALNLQLLLFDRRGWWRTVLISCALYGLLMLAVPLLTGNAVANPVLYFEHVLTSLGVLLPLVVLAGVRWWRARESQDLVSSP